MRLLIEFAPTMTGKVLADFTWDFCKKLSDNSNVSTAGCALTEYGFGVYALENPNVTGDTAFRLHLTADGSRYAAGIFSLSDDNTALQSSVAAIPTTPLLAGDYVAPDNTLLAAVAAYVDTEVTAIKAGVEALTPPDNAGIASALELLQHATYGLNALLTAINAGGGGASLTAADVWGYVTRSLTDKEGFAAQTDLTPVMTAIDALPKVADLVPLAKEATLEEHSAALAELSNPLDAIVAGSDPPITRGQAIDRLYVPEYVGPIIVIPANADPDVQFVHFYGRKGDNTAAAGRTITARALPGQVIDQAMVDKQTLSETLNPDGYAHLTLLRGMEYSITVPWWGAPFEITVTQDANRTIAAYLAPEESGQ